jgi:hypothetical protein
VNSPRGLDGPLRYKALPNRPPCHTKTIAVGAMSIELAPEPANNGHPGPAQPPIRPLRFAPAPMHPPTRPPTRPPTAGMSRPPQSVPGSFLRQQARRFASPRLQSPVHDASGGRGMSSCTPFHWADGDRHGASQQQMELLPLTGWVDHNGVPISAPSMPMRQANAACRACCQKGVCDRLLCLIGFLILAVIIYWMYSSIASVSQTAKPVADQVSSILTKVDHTADTAEALVQSTLTTANAALPTVIHMAEMLNQTTRLVNRINQMALHPAVRIDLDPS